MKRLFIVVLLFFTVKCVPAQCYQPNVAKGNAALSNGKFTEAYDFYSKATKCPDASRFNNGQEAKEGMKKCLPVLTIEGKNVYEITVGAEAGERVFSVQSKRIRMWVIDGSHRRQGIAIDTKKILRDSFHASWEANPTDTPRDLRIRIYGVDGVKDIDAIVIIHQAAGELRLNGRSTIDKTFSSEGGITRIEVSGMSNNQYQITGVDTSWLSVQKNGTYFFLLAKRNETNTMRSNTVIVSSGSAKCTVEINQKKGSLDKPQISTRLRIRNNRLSYDSYTSGKRAFGFIDSKGEVVIAPIFDGCKSYENGLCAVAKNVNGELRVGMIDEDANIVVPFIYKWIDEFCICNRITVVDTNNRIGFLNSKGRLQIPCQYEPDDFLVYYPRFVKGRTIKTNLAVVRKNGLYGAIDTNGDVRVPFIYNYMSDYSGLAMVNKNGKFGFVNEKGDVVIPIEYDDASRYGPGRGSINPHFDPFYDYLYDPYTYVRKGDVIRFIAMPKKRLSENEYTQWTLPLNSGEGERAVLYNLPSFVSNMAPFKKSENGKYGLLYYQTGNWFPGLEGEHDWMGKTWWPRRLVRDGQKWYFINTSGDADTMCYEWAHEYEMVNAGMGKKYVARVEKNNKWGVIDEKGNVVTDFVMDLILPFDNYNGYTLVKRYGRDGYIDIYDNMIRRPNVELISTPKEGLAIIKVDGKYGYYTASGLVTIKAQYDEAKDFSEGLAAVRVDTKWGFIDKNGKNVIPAVFESAESFENNRAIVRIDGKQYQIDRIGNVVD